MKPSFPLFLALSFGVFLGAVVQPAVAHEPAECGCLPSPCAMNPLVLQAVKEAREAIQLTVRMPPGPQP